MITEESIVQAMKNHASYLPIFDNVELAKAAAVLVLLRDQVASSGKKKDLVAAIPVLKKLNVKYLPHCFKHLSKKVNDLISGIALEELIVLPRKGNQNSRKFHDKEVVSWLIKLRNMPQNYTNSWIIRKVQDMCAVAEKQCPSKSWMEGVLAQSNAKSITNGRFGSGRLAFKHTAYVPVENALFAGDCWQIDATRVNFIEHKGEKGKQFLWIIAVKDVHSGDIVGYHFDVVENRWAYLAAIRNAVDNTGYLPYELVMDQFPGHNTPEWQENERWFYNCGVKMTYTSVATGKARLERWFGVLQTVFMQDSAYYYGEGIQSRRLSAHRTKEYLTRCRKEAAKTGWDFDAACSEATRIVEAYRKTSLSRYSKKYGHIDLSPLELHEQSDKPHVNNVQAYQFVRLFGATKQVKVSNLGMIKTRIDNADFFYTIDTFDVIANHESVRLAYDMDNLEVVHLFDVKTDRYLCPAQHQNPVQIYGPNADHTELRRAKERIKRLEKQRKDYLESMTEGVSELDLMLGGVAPKSEVNSAEDNYLMQGLSHTPSPVQPSQSSDVDDDDFEIDIRSQY